jgi:hypothetical protein
MPQYVPGMYETQILAARSCRRPIQNVGTDTREYDVMAWTANTGVLKGAFIPFITNPLEADDLAFNVLATSVIGSISEHLLSGGGLTAASTRSAVGPVAGPRSQPTLGPQLRLPPSLRDLQGAFKAPPNLAEVLKKEGAPALGSAAPERLL